MSSARVEFSAPRPLSRFALPAIGLAVAAHFFVLALIFVTAVSKGGGGSQVVGRLSVSFGVGGTAGQTLQTVVEETNVSTLTPRPTAPQPEPEPVQLHATAPPVREAVRRQRRIATPTPPTTPVATPHTAETTAVEHHQRSGVAPSDAAPGTLDAGTRIIGEGPQTATVGLGTSNDAPGDVRDAYLAMIRARIEANRSYPSAARRRRIEGTVVIQIQISENGVISLLEIKERSGSAHLDRAARRMTEKAGPFPRPPFFPFRTTIPIAFTLL